MTPTENLYYALGEMAYALAAADGKLQREEKENLRSIITREVLPSHPPVDVAEIIFRILDKDRTPVKDAFDMGKQQFALYSHYVSPEMKRHFVRIMQEIAHVYPPVTNEERQLVNDFQEYLTTITGDPVFYQNR